MKKITTICVQLNGTKRSTQANEAESGGFRRGGIGAYIGGCAKERHDQMPRLMAVRDCPAARNRHDSPAAAVAREGMEDRPDDQPARPSGAPERACPLSLSRIFRERSTRRSLSFARRPRRGGMLQNRGGEAYH